MNKDHMKLIVFFSLVLTFSISAFSQEAQTVKTLLTNGEALYAQQEYEEALVVFKRALTTAQQPSNPKAILTATRNIAKCLYASTSLFKK